MFDDWLLTEDRRQKNKIVKLDRSAKKSFYQILDSKAFGSDKRFWKNF